MSSGDESFGFIAGAVLMGIAWIYFGGYSYSNALDNCAKTHNVYQCEMVALPKMGEK